MTTSMRVLLIAMLAGLCPAAATVISFEPAFATVTRGQTFSLDVRISGVSDLFAWQFDLGFNPGVLAANSVSEGSFLSGTGSTVFLPGSIDNAGGVIGFIGGSLLGSSGASGAGTLTSVSFTAIGSGSSAVDFFNVIVLNSFGEGMAADTDGAAVTVPAGAVAEPGAGYLISAGLLSMIAAGGRFTRNAVPPSDRCAGRGVPG